jgi:hypothetical protein
MEVIREESSELMVENDLKTILLKLSKEELINTIIEIAEKYPDIEKLLLFKNAQSGDEIDASKKIIREYINKAKHRGFISRSNTRYAVQGAEITLEKAQDKIEEGDIETAVAMSLAVLKPIITMLSYCDDSDGYISPVIHQSIHTINHAIISRELNDKEQKKLFDLILKEAMKAHYNGWSEWRYELLRVCIYFSQKGDFREKLEKQLNVLILSGDSWNEEYENTQIRLLQLEIIAKCDGQEEAEKFIYQNIKKSNFREKAIIISLEKGDYGEVLHLCLNGEEVDEKLPGLVKKWKDYRYQAYEGLKDLENQRKLATHLIFQNEFSYYHKLKLLYDENEWGKILTGIIEKFETQSYRGSVYLSIIIEEKLTKNILEYCKGYLPSITELYPYLIDSHFERVVELFRGFIKGEAESPSDRRGYRKVCKHIKTFSEVCGTTHSEKLISDLTQKYNRRPTFLDELKKVM